MIGLVRWRQSSPLDCDGLCSWRHATLGTRGQNASAFKYLKPYGVFTMSVIQKHSFVNPWDISWHPIESYKLPLNSGWHHRHPPPSYHVSCFKLELNSFDMSPFNPAPLRPFPRSHGGVFVLLLLAGAEGTRGTQLELLLVKYANQFNNADICWL